MDFLLPGETSKLPKKSTQRAAAADESTMADKLMPQPLSLDDTKQKKCLQRDFRETAQLENDSRSNADINCYIGSELKIINRCT